MSKNRIHNIANVLLIIGGVFLSVILTMESVHFPLSERMDYSDNAIYHYIGYLITIGKMPYIDAFDHKGPLLYVLNALGHVINHQWGIWVIECLSLFIIICSIYITTSKFFNRILSVIITVFFVFDVSAHFWAGDTPDFFSIPLMCIALGISLGLLTKRSLSNINMVVCGMCVAGIFWLKANISGGLFVVYIFILSENLAYKRIRTAMKYVAFNILGFLVLTIPILIWLFANHAVESMFENYFVFSARYSAFHASLENQQNVFAWLLQCPIVIVCFCCIIIYLFYLLLNKSMRIYDNTNAIMICGTLSFIISLGLCVYPGNVYLSYVYILYPGALMIVISTIQRCRKSPVFQNSIVIATCLVGALFFLFYNGRQIMQNFVVEWMEILEETEVKNYIVNNTTASDLIAINSASETGLFLATGRESASRNVYIQANYYNNNNSKDVNKEFWMKYIEELEINHPRIIVNDKIFYNERTLIPEYEMFLSSYIFVGETERFSVYMDPYGEKELLPFS